MKRSKSMCFQGAHTHTLTHHTHFTSNTHIQIGLLGLLRVSSQFYITPPLPTPQKLAENLEVLPPDLGGLLTAIVLITMAVTPLLGQAAGKFSKAYSGDIIIPALDVSAQMPPQTGTASTVDATIPNEVAHNAIVVCGFGDAGQSTLQALSNEYEKMIEAEIRSSIGKDKMSRLEKGLVAFVSEKRK